MLAQITFGKPYGNILLWDLTVLICYSEVHFIRPGAIQRNNTFMSLYLISLHSVTYHSEEHFRVLSTTA